MYAIRHKSSWKYVFGTDYRYSPPHQFCSYEKAILFETEEQAALDMTIRRVSEKLYEVVPVELVVKGEEREHGTN